MLGANLPLPRPRQALLFFVDTAVLVAALLLSLHLRHPRKLATGFEDGVLVPRVLLATFIVQLCLYFGELYDDRAMRWFSEFLLRLGQALVVAFVLLSLIYYLAPSLLIGRGILGMHFLLVLSGLLAWRGLHHVLSRHAALSENVLIVGTGVTAQQVGLEMVRRTPLGFQVVGFLGEHRAEVGRRLVNPSVIGTTADLLPLVDELGVRRIIVALEDRRGRMPVDELLACRMKGIVVEEASHSFESLTGKILVNNLRPSTLVFSQGFRKSALLRGAKRVVDLVASAVLFVVTAPLIAFLMALIRLESPGAAIFRQERMGENGRSFDLLKLRTMRNDAERDTGPVWAATGGDARITRVGFWLRKTRLDELPQLWNVLRGEMSFVGPRPERPAFVAQLRQVIPYYDERHTVKPGITGWAQVKFRYGSTIEDAEEKLQYDLYYVKRMSVLFDLFIVFKTITVVLFGKGAQ